jgi:hypothetical protein
MRFAYRDVRDHSWLMAMSWRPASAATNCCKDVHAAPLRTRSLHFAILGLARRRDCTDSIRLYGRYEHHEAQRSDGERGETFISAPIHFPFRAQPASLRSSQ